MSLRRTVAIGLVGSSLDRGAGADRWDRWRPSVDLCRHDDLVVHRFDLLHTSREGSIAKVVAADIATTSPETTVVTHEIRLRDPWDFSDVYECLHQFATDYAFDPEREDYLVHVTTGTHVAQICLFLLTETGYLPGRLIQTSPPRPRSQTAGSYSIIDLDLSKYDRLAARFERQKRADLSSLKAGIETRSQIFNDVIARIERVAVGSRAPMLLMGPTGAGKSHLARRIYDLKKSRQRVAGGFVSVNCATVRGDAAMSALFGHVKGSFTGALRDRPGLLKSAHGGVLFLDEIGELGPDEQAALLGALEEKRFLPVGADHETQSDFQLIAGTNADLPSAVRAGRFREDLLARINLWTFRLPGLADRPEDIEPNLEHELRETSASLGIRVSMSTEARAEFLRFATSPEARWPGNFRDFNGAIMRMAALAAGGRITTELVRDESEALLDAWREQATPDNAEVLSDLLSAEAIHEIDLFDRAQLSTVIRVIRRSKSLSEAGRVLFAVSRTRKAAPNDADRLRKYLARFGLDWKAIRLPERGFQNSAAAALRDRYW
jgi:transcriptional regulatory protein RtcR